MLVPLALARQELHFSKRTKKIEQVRRAELVGSNGGFTLLKVWDPPPKSVKGLLLEIEDLVRWKVVRRDFSSWAHAIDLRRAFRKGTFCPGPEGPVELTLLEALAVKFPVDVAAVVADREAAAHYAKMLEGQPKAECVRRLVRGWETWDLCFLAKALGDRAPLFLKGCGHHDAALRPTVAFCLKKFAF
jgi:hypothetical protein